MDPLLTIDLGADGDGRAAQVVVVSDTHAPRFWKGCPPALLPALAEADLVLHAGDVCVPGVLDELAALAAPAPVVAVLGNNDGPDVGRWSGSPAGGPVPETVELDLGGLRVAMTHDAGPRTGRDRRMRRRFPEADLVVFGHSHIPLDEPEGAVHLFNPGSPTDKRRQPTGTYGVLEVSGGRLVGHRVVPLPAPTR